MAILDIVARRVSTSRSAVGDDVADRRKTEAGTKPFPENLLGMARPNLNSTSTSLPTFQLTEIKTPWPTPLSVIFKIFQRLARSGHWNPSWPMHLARSRIRAVSGQVANLVVNTVPRRTSVCSAQKDTALSAFLGRDVKRSARIWGNGKRHSLVRLNLLSHLPPNSAP